MASSFVNLLSTCAWVALLCGFSVGFTWKIRRRTIMGKKVKLREKMVRHGHDAVVTTNVVAYREEIYTKDGTHMQRYVRKGAVLQTFDSLHEEGFSYLADNSYIHSGYRLHYTFHQCLGSLFQLHNETLNVWTHLIGTLIFIGLIVIVSLSHYDTLNVTATEKTAKILPTKCDLAHMPYLIDGLHTYRTMAIKTLHTATEKLTCSPVHSKSLKEYSTATLMFDYVLDRIPSMERVHASIESHASRLSRSLSESADTLSSFVSSISIHTRTLKGDLKELRNKLMYVTDSNTKWLTHPVSLKIQGLKQQLHHRLDQFSEYLHEITKEIDTDETVKFAIDEYHSLVKSLKNGLKTMSTADLNMSDQHHVSAWPLMVFLISATICLGSSTVFHLLYVYNRDVSYFLSRLDYAGIAVMIAGSCFPLIYYSFYCNPWILRFYLTAISIFGVATFVMSLVPEFGKSEYIIVRTSVFTSMAGFGVIPMLHLMWKYGINDPHVTVLIWPLCQMGLLYLGGAYVYISRFPERFYPGKFDLWFSSHQIWHVCVVLAALIHYQNAMQHYQWRWETECT